MFSIVPFGRNVCLRQYKKEAKGSKPLLNFECLAYVHSILESFSSYRTQTPILGSKFRRSQGFHFVLHTMYPYAGSFKDNLLER